MVGLSIVQSTSRNLELVVDEIWHFPVSSICASSRARATTGIHAEYVKGCLTFGQLLPIIARLFPRAAYEDMLWEAEPTQKGSYM